MQMVAKREGTGIIHKLSVWSIIDNRDVIVYFCLSILFSLVFLEICMSAD